MKNLLLFACMAFDLSFPQRISTLDRLQPEFLTRVRKETEDLARQRSPVGLKTGLNDYRCVLHAHSYLSHDSRGTIAEMAAAAKAAKIDALFLTNHPQKEKDVVAEGQREAVDGVLFIPGAETKGLLVFPGDNHLPPDYLALQPYIDAVNDSGGLVFIAHPEEHNNWNLRGLVGMEIYNTHADFKDERELLATFQPKDAAGYGKLLNLLNTMNRFPQEAFAALFDRPTRNLARYDTIAKSGPFAGIAGNDSHQNTGFILRGAEDGKIQIEDPLGEVVGTLDSKKNPLLKTLFGEPTPGKELLRRILDPYPVSLHYVSTHVLAREKSSAALKAALKAGRTYVAFDWIADPTGTTFMAQADGKTLTIGDTVELRPDLRIRVELPLSASIRLLSDGEEVARANGRTLEFAPNRPGVYRVEASLPLGGEQRPWIYTGAIRIVNERR